MRSILILLTINLFIAQSVFGQKTNSNEDGLVIGKIVDQQTGKALEYVSVKLFKAADSTIVSGAFTTVDGKYRIPCQYGSFYLKITFMNYDPILVSAITVKTALPIFNVGTLKMRKISEKTEREIKVIAEKDVLKAGIDKKIYNVAEDLNVRGGTANDILQRLPSVEVDQDGKVMLRGEGSVTVLIDGRPSSLSGGNGKTLLDALPAGSIERIEIVTNPSAKYDPDGTSGIINIVLKKNKLNGFNGLVSTNLATTFQNRGNVAEGNLSLSYRTGIFNIYGTYNARYLEGYRNNYSHITQGSGATYFNLDQSRVGTDLNAGQTFRFGMDINLKARNTLGFSATGNIGVRDRTGDLWNSSYDVLGQRDSLWLRSSYDPSQQRNFDFNVNYKYDFKNERGNLTFDATQSLGNENIQGYYTQSYYTPDSLLTSYPELIQELRNTEKNNITTLQSDFTYLFPKLGARFESGAKAIIRDQSVNPFSSTYDWSAQMNLEDSLANFLYEYNEQIYSLYAVYGQQINRVKFQGGLRAENAYQIPNLVTDSIRIVNHYINLFPSAHLRYVLKPKSEISLSYSRRITRASSADLNPFTNYSDPFNLRTGNPYLQPEFIHSFDLGYSLEKAKYSITASTYYRNSTGVISRVKEFYENGTSAVTFMNIAETKSLGSEFVCMFRPTNWWKNTFSYNANYIWYITNQVDLPNRQGFNHNFKYNSSVEFWKKTATLQLSVTYNGPRVTVQGIAQRQGPIDLAFEKKLQGGKWTVGARVTDIFNKQGFYMQVNRPGVEQTAEFKWLTRRFYLSASYKFGKLEMSNKSKLPGAEGGAE
ncbi:MAG: TonB-dependent receptor [Crocinitomicaceae bacterium]|nr:TonB-dependent receptor [Crocinitomicaceae bacterium]MBP6032808.1 TonB-dependent receptor [Crocinitomicaceae bacterium]